MRVAQIHAGAEVGLQPRASTVLGAGHHKHPRARGEWQVVFAERIGVQQRSAFLPIFGGGVDLDPQRIKTVTAQQRSASLGYGIGGRCRRKWKLVFGVVMILVLGIGTRRLTKLSIQEHAANAGDVGQCPIKHLSPALVLIEALMHKVSQVAATLRDSDGNHLVDAAISGITLKPVITCFVAQEADEVSRRREADAEHLGIFCRVMKFVKRARCWFRFRRQQADFLRVDIFPIA